MKLPAIIILAAGASSRMRGSDKVLQVVDGQPQIRRLAGIALQTGCRVIVVVSPNATHKQAALAGLEVTVVDAPDAGEGMAASIRAGARSAGPGTAVMILPADMPELDLVDLQSMVSNHLEYPEAILRGASFGMPGHPVLIPPDLVAALQGLAGDEGARSLVSRHASRLQLVPLPGDHAVLDLDTPEDWDNWRTSRDGPRANDLTEAMDREHPTMRDPLQAAAHCPDDADLAVITFFHDHDREIPILQTALQCDAFYVGAQGSRRVAETRQGRLRAGGATDPDLARLHAPIGLLPSARDVRLLAISVLAEIAAISDKDL